MIIAHSRPKGITWTIDTGNGATMIGPGANLDDGRPDTLSAFTWPTGAQTLTTEFKLRGDWTSGSIVPRLAGFSNILLPVGTRIAVAFRRAGDSAGTYPYTPSQLFASFVQIFKGVRGERTAWLLMDAGATAVIGVEFTITNNVNGAASIAPATLFQLGEAVIASGDDVDIDAKRTLDTIDPLTADFQWSRQPYLDPGCVYRQLGFNFATDDESVYFGGNALDIEALIAKIDRGQSCVYIPRYTDSNGTFSNQYLHRTAVLGIATKLPRISHEDGPIFSSAGCTVTEAPIPT